LARFVFRTGTHIGTHFLNFLRRRVLLGGDLLPPITLIAPRRETPIDLRHHLQVGVPELSRDELVRRSGADGRIA
jgi:hypothetical protein